MELREVTKPAWRVCVRSTHRASLLHRLWPRYSKWFGKPEVFIAEAERSTYEQHFAPEVLRCGGAGLEQHVQAMLAATPAGHWLVVVDDNISAMRINGRSATPGVLQAMIEEACWGFWLSRATSRPDSREAPKSH